MTILFSNNLQRIYIFSLISLSTLGLLCNGCASFGNYMGARADRNAKKKFAKVQPYFPLDAVIIPGIPFENNHWDRVMKSRVLWSWILYKNGMVKNIIYSGDAVYSPYKEALIMGLYAQKLGIPKEHIFYETKAHHSTENVYYSYLLAKEQGFKTIALATDPYFQSPILKGFTKRRFASYIHHIPFVKDSLIKYDALDPIIDPSSAKVENFVPITSQKSSKARFEGTLGRDINWHQYSNGRVEEL